MDIDRSRIDVRSRGQIASSSRSREKTRPGFSMQVPQQAEFGGAELNGAPPRRTRCASTSISISRISQQFAGQRRTYPPHHRADAGDQLAWAERLGHVIVGAGLQARECDRFPLHARSA